MSDIANENYAIEIPKSHKQSRRRAEDSVQKLIGCVAVVGEKMNSPFLLESVRITDHFQEVVNRIIAERTHPTRYSAVRDNVHVIGKTLWIRTGRGDLGFAVVVDANLVGPVDLENCRFLTTVLHEMIHVLYEARHLKILGEKEYCAGSQTKEQLMDRYARSLIDEFDVDRLVDDVVSVLVTKNDGTRLYLRELDEVQGIQWVDGLMNGLNQLPTVIDEIVHRFRIREIDIDELAVRLLPRVKDLLILLVHTFSIHINSDQCPCIAERMKNTEASQRFFKEHLDTILGQLSNSVTPVEDSVKILAKSIEEIFGYCGLSFRTVPQGLYIEVKEPTR